MKKTGIVTGASGGLGSEFVRHLLSEGLDEIWVVARSKEKLDKMKAEYGDIIRPVICDLCKPEELERINLMLNQEAPDIRILINNAGFAKMGRYDEFTTEELSATVDLNCRTMVLLCHFVIPYMNRGARILNISSASSFQPNPYINLYASTKVFIRSYSRSLNYELKDKGITCTAVCPGWIDTDMIEKERNGKKIHFPGLVTAGRVAEKALKDSAKGKDMSVCSAFVKFEHLSSKLLPQKLIMKMWIKGIKDYI